MYRSPSRYICTDLRLDIYVWILSPAGGVGGGAGAGAGPAGGVVAAEKTRVESVELVLPPHANHQVPVGLSNLSVCLLNQVTLMMFSV